MVITKKDKKLLLFIASFIIVFWFIYLSVSALFTKVAFHSDINKLTSLGSKLDWINVSKHLTNKDLENRVVLLDFWTYACVNCMQVLPEIQKLEEQFGDKITVIGIHSGKFNNEKNTVAIRNAVLKYNIKHAVVNDADFKIWKNFGVEAWPTLILINPKGDVEKVYAGEGNANAITNDVKKLISKYSLQLSKTDLPIALESAKAVGHVLQYPAKIAYAKNFSYKNIVKTSALLIADSSANKIDIASLNGAILLEVGSGQAGFRDGDISSAQFKSPKGLLYRDNILYVADTGNNALRKVDFKNNQVSTLIGTGVRGLPINSEISVKNAAKNFDLASPWDLEFFPDQNNIIIANAGTHQLIKYNITQAKLSPFAGSGSEDIVDGKYPRNALAQTSGLSAFGGKLYFVDSETSSLRVADKNGEVKTLVGKGLFVFGHQNGSASVALMQHPVGLVADDTGVYIADTHNNIIRKYNLATGTLSDYSGNMRGDGLGSAKNTSYNEPEAIISVLDKFYIADTNNNRIVTLNRASGNSVLLDTVPPLKMPKEGMLEYLPNLEKIPSQIVKSDSDVTLSFVMKPGWKINESAPSFFNLVEIRNKKEATLISRMDWSVIKSGSVKLPKLSSKREYYLQGAVYYCQDKANALCLIRSYQQKLLPKKSSKNDKIQIEFIYQ